MMKKSFVSMLLTMAMVLSMLFGMMVVPASAENTATLTVSNGAGQLGEIIEVSIAVSADSYLVNGDFDLTYDPAAMSYVPDSCEASSLMEGAYWVANEPRKGLVSISFATEASVGLTAEGALFTLQFKITNTNEMQTSMSLTASPLRGCNGGDDFDVKPTVVEGKVSIAEAIIGDVTGDTIVNIDDAATVFRFVNRIVNLEGAALAKADFNGDGLVNLFDAARLFYMANELL